MEKFSLIFLLIIFISVPLKAYARLGFEENAFPEFVTSARALALGNAYLCKVDDAWSAFYNPAGLGTVRNIQFHLLNAHLEASKGLLDVTANGPATSFPGNFMDSYDPDKLRTMLSTHQGSLAHSRANFFPNITARGLTLGYLYSQRDRATINTDTENLYEITERKDQGPVMALNASLFGGVLKLGVSGVYLMRKEMYSATSPTEEVVIDDSNYTYGRSLQVTAGTRLTLPFTFLPTLAAVLRNATNNDWERTEFSGPPDKIKQTVDLGFSITPQIGTSTRLHLEANLKDVNNQYDSDIKRRIAAGMELDFNRRIFVRAGTGDGWGSGGLGVRSRTFILDLTTYAVDRSLDGFREEEDRRWVFSVSSGF